MYYEPFLHFHSHQVSKLAVMPSCWYGTNLCIQVSMDHNIVIHPLPSKHSLIISEFTSLFLLSSLPTPTFPSIYHTFFRLTPFLSFYNMGGETLARETNFYLLLSDIFIYINFHYWHLKNVCVHNETEIKKNATSHFTLKELLAILLEFIFPTVLN